MEAPTSTPDARSIRAVLISTDAVFRRECRRILQDPGMPVELELELDRSFTGIGDAELEELRRADPGLVIVDLESDPQVGLLFVQFLVESGQPGAMVAAGSDLSQELLLQAIQAGVTEVLAKPLDPAQVREALLRVLRKTGRKSQQEERRTEPGRTITVTSAKGGVGATALATNLAVSIHRLTRQRTLLLDLDVELGETAFLLGMEPKFSLVDLLRNYHRLDTGLLASFVTHHESGIEVVPAPFQPADLDAVSGDRLRQVLRLLRDHYEWVVIDKPTGFHAALDCAIEDADETYLVTTADLQSLRNVSRSLPRLRELLDSRDDAPLRLVVNRFQPNQVVTLKEIEETVGMEVFFTLRNDFAALTESINEGSPIAARGSSNYASDVRKLASTITSIEVNSASRKGVFRDFVGAWRRGRK